MANAVSTSRMSKLLIPNLSREVRALRGAMSAMALFPQSSFPRYNSARSVSPASGEISEIRWFRRLRYVNDATFSRDEMSRISLS